MLFFFVFTFFFEGYLGSFVLISLFLFKKKITFKKSDSLNFSLVFLLTLFSLFCFVSLCLLSLLLVFSLHAFSLFFSSFFLFPCFLSLGLPLAMFIYSLSCASSVDSFFLKIHFYLFFFFFQKKKTSFFICSSFFCKTVFVPSPLLFRPFSCLFLFFQSCSFEQEKMTFFLAEKPLV